MKKKFNFYCVLMMVAVVIGGSFAFIEGIDDMIAGFKDGWNEGEASAQQKPENRTTVSYISLRPIDGDHYDYTIVNSRTGRKEPMQPVDIKLKSTGSVEPNPWMRIAAGLSSIIFVIVMVMFWIHFIKMILAVNRGMAFDRPIERRLRFIGWLLIVMYASEWGISGFSYLINRSLVEVSGYEVVMDDYPSLMTLLAGIGMLLVSQIFAIGRQMKEDQELTI